MWSPPRRSCLALVGTPPAKTSRALGAAGFLRCPEPMGLIVWRILLRRLPSFSWARHHPESRSLSALVDGGRRSHLISCAITALAIWASACSNATQACIVTCAAPEGFLVEAPAGIIQSFRLSGPACADVKFACQGEAPSSSVTPGCTQYLIFGGAGTCEIAATLTGGTVVSETVTITATGGCCPQGYPDPSEWVIDAGASDAEGE